MTRRWPGFLLIAVLLVLWEYASAAKLIDPVSMPRISIIVVMVGTSPRLARLLRSPKRSAMTSQMRRS